MIDNLSEAKILSEFIKREILPLVCRIDKLEKNMKLKPPHKRHVKIPKRRIRAIPRPQCESPK
jgi:hypothetical protein